MCGQAAGTGCLRCRKMFGAYMAYVNDKPVLLVCDNTVYVKKLACIGELMASAERGLPYEGASLLIGEYIHFYNHERLQRKTKLTPLDKRSQCAA